MLTLKQLQEEQKPWVKHNFPERLDYHPFLGLMEEVGELAHSHLKLLQGIRVNEDHHAKAKDAVGDIVIFLADYCSARGYDLQECVEKTWAEVKQRDWKTNKVNGL
jgi:NTP pyrophosphatase (non-canonical NTP hydrolase)